MLLGTVAYAIFGHLQLPILAFELAGDAARAKDVVDGRIDDFRQALLADWFAFIPGYVLTIALGARRGSGRAAAIGIALVLVAGQADIFENLSLWRGLGTTNDAAFAAARVFAIIKFCALVPALVIAVRGLTRPAAG